MDASIANQHWAEIIVGELAANAVSVVCIAPGSRSTPLTFAFSRQPEIEVFVHLDERSAAFFALGYALATGRPAALVSTSGTAAANFFPAIIEASVAQVPLLVLTADRPHELRASGANQTIDQVKMYGDHVRQFVDVALPEPDPSPKMLRSLRTLTSRAVAASLSPVPGPVHLNTPFRKPLEPTEVNRSDSSASTRPFTQISQGVLVPSEAQIQMLVEAVEAAPRGLIICGPRSPAGRFPEEVRLLARRTGYPILADGLSGVRFGAGEPLVLGGYETFLTPDAIESWAKPELILQFGARPTSKSIEWMLENLAEVRRVAVGRTQTWQDPAHALNAFLVADPAEVCAALSERLSPPHGEVNAAWQASYQLAEAQAWHTIDEKRTGEFFEGAVLAEVLEAAPDGTPLFVASSLPVRHLDQFGRPSSKTLPAFGNRGASGIDGTVSTALGLSAGLGQRIILVTGDLAFYHDMNGLLALKRQGVQATIVLINNDGGGIFHRLPVAQHDPPFTELFLTPHGLSFGPAAELYGLDYSHPETADAFRTAFTQSFMDDRSHLIELTTDSAHFEVLRRELVRETALNIQRVSKQKLAEG